MKCPCCSDKLLPHCNHRQGLYWYCPSCRQKMPVVHQYKHNMRYKDDLGIYPLSSSSSTNSLIT